MTNREAESFANLLVRITTYFAMAVVWTITKWPVWLFFVSALGLMMGSRYFFREYPFDRIEQ